ncbi:hypothetical protein Pla163_26570 [Planctomycetes bacterium Pla163]|uniref:DUF2723 domain-containing protein n=1 Tax=Rohdeia mirabilis TaxID=2528008 RepID=A0A518D255_9BACT|nr:hypothetical protein Pla163_26570 [Planctomycetes bacterium Pla163]
MQAPTETPDDHEPAEREPAEPAPIEPVPIGDVVARGHEGPERSTARRAALIAFVLSAAWLAPRLAPGVTFEDAGELVAVADSFGVPHPPGYPLWTLLAGFATEIAGWFSIEPARACVGFSWLTAAGACGALGLLLARRGVVWPVAGAVGALLALTPTFASTATVVEVYGLAAFVQMLFVAAALDPAPSARLSFALFGLGLAAHPGTLFLAPLLFVGVDSARALGRRVVSSPWILPGLLLYLWVPLRSHFDPAVDWGDPQTTARFLDHVLRSQYAVGGARTSADLLELARLTFEQTIGQSLVFMGVGMVAVLAALRRSRAVRWLVLASVWGAALVFWFVRYPLGELDAFTRWSAEVRLAPSFQPLFLALFAAAVVALLHALERSRVVLVAPLLMAIALVLPDGYTTVVDGLDDVRASRGAALWANAALDECPPDALLVVGRIGATDVLGFPLLHAQLVEGRRPDVTVVDRQLLLAPWYREQLARRAPDLSQWLAELGGTLPSTSDQGRLHRTVGTALGALVGGSRHVVWTDPPGPQARGGRAFVPGGVLWFADAMPLEPGAEPSANWIAHEPASPWRELHRRLAIERDGARAEGLERSGRAQDARSLRDAMAERYGPPDPRSLDQP